MSANWKHSTRARQISSPRHRTLTTLTTNGDHATLAAVPADEPARRYTSSTMPVPARINGTRIHPINIGHNTPVGGVCLFSRP